MSRRILVTTILSIIMSISTFQVQLWMILLTTVVLEPTVALGGSNIFGFFRKRRHKFNSEQQREAETNIVVATTTVTEPVANNPDDAAAAQRGVQSLAITTSMGSLSFINTQNQAPKETVVSPAVILIVSSNDKRHLPKTIGWTTSVWTN